MIFFFLKNISQPCFFGFSCFNLFGRQGYWVVLPASLPFQYNVLLEIIIIIKCGQIVLFYWQLMVGSPFFPWQAPRSRTLLMHGFIYHTIHEQYSIIALWYYHQFSVISMRWCFRGKAPYPPKWSAINPWRGQLWYTLGLM